MNIIPKCKESGLCIVSEMESVDAFHKAGPTHKKTFITFEGEETEHYVYGRDVECWRVGSYSGTGKKVSSIRIEESHEPNGRGKTYVGEQITLEELGLPTPKKASTEEVEVLCRKGQYRVNAKGTQVFDTTKEGNFLLAVTGGCGYQWREDVKPAIDALKAKAKVYKVRGTKGGGWMTHIFVF